jgi:hypothetical protein
MSLLLADRGHYVHDTDTEQRAVVFVYYVHDTDTNSTDPPRAFAKSQTHPPTSQLVFAFSLGFLTTSSGVSRQGEFKNNTNIFIFTKSPCRKLFPRKPTRTSVCQFFLDFFLFDRGFGCFKNTTKNVLQKNCVEIFTKKLTKNRNSMDFIRFFLDLFFYHVFGRFSVRGVQKHYLKTANFNASLCFFTPDSS